MVLFQQFSFTQLKKCFFAVHYWEELKKVLSCFGDSCEDFGLEDHPEIATEIIKEGFTLEFMKNALIKPVLSLKNKTLLLDWWKQVEGGNPEAPLPPESEIFKSGSYSSFIFLYFKMATEVNVFAHLGQTLFTHMKESLFSDNVEADSDDDEDDAKDVAENGHGENVNTSEENGVENVETKIDSESVPEDKEEDTTASNSEEPSASTEDVKESEPVKENKPKTITSMYGKVYTLKE